MSHRSPETEFNANVKRLHKDAAALAAHASAVDQPATKPPRWLRLTVDALAVIGGFTVLHAAWHLLSRLLHR